MLEKQGEHRTFPLRVSELGGDNTHNSKMFLNLGLTLHIPILRKKDGLRVVWLIAGGLVGGVSSKE